MARTRGAEAFTALAEAEAEGQRLKAEVVRLAEVKRVLAREAAVTQQEASEAYLRCYTKCQAQVSAAKAAQAESRRAEAEAEKRLVAALTAAPSARPLEAQGSGILATPAVLSCGLRSPKLFSHGLRDKVYDHP